MMDDTPYCRLYIATEQGRDAVQSALDAEIAKQFPELRVEATVRKNLGHRPGRNSPYDPIESSPWTAEVDAEDDSPEAFESFQRGMGVVIRELRSRGPVVTASCDFEDRVAAETGWNWSVATPEPPR